MRSILVDRGDDYGFTLEGKPGSEISTGRDLARNQRLGYKIIFYARTGQKVSSPTVLPKGVAVVDTNGYGIAANSYVAAEASMGLRALQSLFLLPGRPPVVAG